MTDNDIPRLKKGSYIGFFIVLLVVFISAIVILINPYTFGKPYYNSTLNDSWSPYNDLNFSNANVVVNYIKSSHIANIPRTTRFYKNFKELNDSQADEIAAISDNAQEALDNYQSNSDSNELTRALFYAQEALFYLKSYPFINCANDIEKIAKGYHPLFFYLSAENKERVMKISGLKNQLIDEFRFVSYYSGNINETILRALRAENFDNTYLDVNKLGCNNFRNYIQKDYKTQMSLFIFRFAAIILFVVLGLILGITVMKARRDIRRVISFVDWIKQLFNPREIKNRTIENILKTNSIVTTFSALFSLALQMLGLSNKLILGLIFICILSFLTSIFLGIASLNRTNEKAKRWCYNFFIFGLALFIAFWIWIIFGGILSSIIDKIGESARTYLNNQTVIK